MAVGCFKEYIFHEREKKRAENGIKIISEADMTEERKTNDSNMCMCGGGRGERERERERAIWS
jgi:hypothetical protein